MPLSLKYFLYVLQMTMMGSIIKFSKQRTQTKELIIMSANSTNCIYKMTGLLGRMRLQVKSFTTSDEMHKFLNKQTDNDWCERSGSTLPTTRGTYAFAGGSYHNVKDMDAGMLAHC
jgi:hypothetical protein